MIGDGGLNNDWQATISLNAKSDQSYSSYISCLCYKLFKTKTKSLVKEAKNTLIIYLNSTTIVDFLMDKGLPRGNKLKAGLKIPEWIFENNEFRKACVRGLIDTDGCLYIHIHKSKWGKTYRNLGLNFSSYSSELLHQVAEILHENDIVPHINKSGTGIFLYSVPAIERYLRVFSSSNNRITSIYNQWRDARVV